ncbi:MAG: DUF1343 domain-containing protein [Bacteroidota bacterium]|nr:DUF1343 domain-containing protein [Bacteroidota bacterium]MDP4234605.1 DUF1343 domain-containing protein [Bacteroidota bacterium]MDP4243796.1 DUF1343 domain-containing protein [Bacteroidota bacterium]MDP4288966.1 DUF1343 domain-containing protein [Bacteroidota bacterium]
MRQKYVGFLLAILLVATSAKAQVVTGLDNLASQHFAALKGKHIGLISNQTGRTASGELGADLLANEHSLKLVALFAPEHGLMGTRKAGVPSDSAEWYHGVRVYSLYGSTRKPTKKMLRGINALVFDLQDIGVRPYTYLSTMVLAMEAAAEQGIPFYVLDRPNPLSGERIEGNTLDPTLKSFVGALPIPYLHGLTLGELARMAKAKAWFNKAQKLKLTVIPMRGWKRSMYWNETGLPWTAPSPNIPHFENAVGAAMLGATGELGVLSIGIGTDAPFLRMGSTLLGTSEILRIADSIYHGTASINAEDFVGQNAGQTKSYHGVRISVSSLHAIPSLYPLQYQLLEAMLHDTAFRKSFDALPFSVDAMFDKVTGMRGLRDILIRCADLARVFANWQRDCDAFRRDRMPYLLYH